VLRVTEIAQLFDDITKAASKKAEPIIYNVVLMNAGRQTELSMAIALALQYQLTRWHSHSKSGDFVIDLPITDT